MLLSDIRRDDRFEGFLIVRSAEQRAAASGKNYLDMTLADRSGSINAKMWDGIVQPPVAGSIVKVRATGNEFNGRMQLRVTALKTADRRDAVDMSSLIPCAPEDPRAMMDEIEAWGREKGVRYAVLCSAMTRKEAHQMYEKLGYGEVKGYKKYL